MSLIELYFRKDVVLRSSKTALLVGSVLALINYAEFIISGTLTHQHLLKIALTFLVPYAVSTHASVSAIKHTTG